MTEPIARIEAALARLGAEHEPPPGWEARVLAAAAKHKPRPWWLSLVPAIPIAAVAVVGVVVVVLMMRDRTSNVSSGKLALDVRISHGDVYRGPADAFVGDTMQAKVHGAAPAALWIYRDGKLVTSCPGDPRCKGNGGELALDVVLETGGEWVSVAVGSREASAPPHRSYDDGIAKLPVGTFSEHRFNVK